MLIKLQKPIRIKNVTYNPEDTIDLEETQANILIAKGLAVKQPVEPKENIFTKLYGTDFPIPMNTLRTKIFNEFLNAISRKHIVKPNPEGYLTTCLSCGGNLLVNKYTGNTYCYSCKRELPFEYLFEILKGLDIYSIVQEIQNQQLKRKVMRW
jgi:hypothetical protein